VRGEQSEHVQKVIPGKSRPGLTEDELEYEYDWRIGGEE
jgi:hypothetical protein